MKPRHGSRQNAMTFASAASVGPEEIHGFVMSPDGKNSNDGWRRSSQTTDLHCDAAQIESASSTTQLCQTAAHIMIINKTNDVTRLDYAHY